MRFVLEIGVVVAAAVAMLVAIPKPARRKREHAKARAPARPVDLERLERVVVTGRATAADVHVRLRPVLQQIAAARLSYHGVRLDRNPAAAHRLLGDELWEIVRLDRTWPEDRRGPGLSLDQLNAAIARLEEL